MAIRYVPRRKKYFKKGVEEVKYFAIPVTSGTLGIKELAQEISQGSIVKESAIVSVLIELSNIMKRRLSDGFNIKIEGIGTFGIAISSPGYDSADDINTKKVEFTKVSFRPDSSLNKQFKNLTFTPMPPPPKGYVTKAECIQSKKDRKIKEDKELKEKKAKKHLNN